MAKLGEVRIGISGWRYPPWRNVFYPKDLPQRLELEYVASKLNSVEINGSFYSLQYPSSYADWADSTPPEFVFSVKGSRFITHVRKLKDVAKGKEPWQRLMIARRRKTLILCTQCHHQLHTGTLPDRASAQGKSKGRAVYG